MTEELKNDLQDGHFFGPDTSRVNFEAGGAKYFR